MASDAEVHDPKLSLDALKKALPNSMAAYGQRLLNQCVSTEVDQDLAKSIAEFGLAWLRCKRSLQFGDSLSALSCGGEHSS